MDLLRLTALIALMAGVDCAAEPAPEDASDDEGTLNVLDGSPQDAFDTALRIAPAAKSCAGRQKLLAALQFTKDRALGGVPSSPAARATRMRSG